MAVTISGTIKIDVPVAGATVTLVCRRPTAQELSKFLNARFETQGRKVKSRLYEARTALIDKILVDVKNAEYATPEGEPKPLNCATVLGEREVEYWTAVNGAPVQSWKDLIPMSWKSSAAMHFEDQQPEEGGEGN